MLQQTRQEQNDSLIRALNNAQVNVNDDVKDLDDKL